MKSFRTMFPIFGVVVALAGCSAETGANSGVDSANAVESKTALSKDEAAGDKAGRPHGRRPHGGPDFLVFAALHENIGLTAAQRSTLEGLVAQSKPAAPPQPDKARVGALAAAIRAGNVDATTVQAPAPTDTTMSERIAASAKNLATLHSTLTKEQRIALVDAVSAKHAKGPGREGGEGRRPPPSAEGHDRGGPFGGLLAELDLTAAQREAIKTKHEASKPAEVDREFMKAKFEGMKKEMDAKLQTFENDAFDAAAFVARPAGAPGFGPHVDRRANDLAALVSVLDQAQREKLAQRIEQGPPARLERPAR